jgi:peptidyl-prolyl cis-trans isomerase C
MPGSRRKIHCLLAFAAIILMACQKPDGISGDDVAITVGEYSIKVSELKRSIRRLAIEAEIRTDDAGMLVDLFLDKILDHYLVLEYGRQKGIFVTDDEWESAVEAVKQDYPEDEFQKILLRGYIDFEEWKRDVKEQVLIDKIVSHVSSGLSRPSAREIKAYYKAHQSEFEHPRQVRFRQVVTRNRAEADALHKRLSRGEDFAELARTHSIAPEAKNGGEVGWVSEGELATEMEKMLFSLSPRRISPVVATEYGYHIFQVLEKRPAGLQGLSDASQQIKLSLYFDKRRHYLEEWLDGLRKQTPVEINEAALESIQME